MITIKQAEDIALLPWSNNFVVIGWWSNVLLSKSFYEDQLFIRNLFRWIEYIWDNIFKVASGTTINQFVTYISQNYASNILNPLFGLPGTVGWAIVNNSESFGLTFGDIVQSIDMIDSFGILKTISQYDKWYRYTEFKWTQSLIISATIHVPMKIDHTLHEPKRYMDWRLDHQAYTNTCGSYFANIQIPKNQLDTYSSQIEKILAIPDNKIKEQLKNDTIDTITIHAWWLSQSCNMLGYIHHGVKVYEKHGNFLVNYDNTDPVHILQLADIIKSAVFDRFGLLLHEEVVII